MKHRTINPAYIVLFDGVCNLCNSSVQFIIKHDKKAQFSFASLQGEFGQRFLKEKRLPLDHFNSFMLLENEKVFSKSTGALRMLKHLGAKWQFFYIFIIVPKPIRDSVYNFISKNRYRWFGKKETCWLPTAELKKRFLN